MSKTNLRTTLSALCTALLFGAASFAFAAEGPYGGNTAAVPGIIQAENYDTGGQGIAYSVNSTNGSANSYRADGIDLETTSDTGGGSSLGWTTSGQWFRYTVKVAAAGKYTVSFRVAAPSAVSGAFHIANSSGNNLSGEVNVPQTGGWQTWTTVTASVTLPAGVQTLTIAQDNPGWNINYATFASASSSGEAPYGGTPAAIPGTVQVENYDTGGQGVGYNVSSSNGSANSYRSDGVDLEATTDTGGGDDMGWTAAGQWFRYTVNVAAAGTYTITFRVAAESAVTDAFHVSNSSGTDLSGPVAIPDTGDWQTWTNVTATVTLPAGVQTLTINQDSPGWNINYATFVSASSASEAPYGGTPAAIPGTVQVENYDNGGQGVGYDVSSTNGTANSYRSDGVDLQVTTDTGGGYDLGWTAAGQWFRYTVNVAAAGTYTVTFRVAAESAVADAFHISNSSGANLSGSISVPNTGDWQNWANVTASITLPAGVQTLTINQDNPGWNIGYATFASGSSTGTNYTAAEVLAGIKARMTSTNQVNTEPHINTMTGAMNVNVYQVVPGVFTYTSSMAIDDDGSDPDSDPDHENQTSWQDSSGAQLGAHHVPYYVLGDDCWDNESTQGGHYTTCPHFYYKNWNITGRQFALIFYNGKVEGAVFGDTQGTDVTPTSDNDSRQLGEASVEAAYLVGIPDSGTTGGVESGVTVTIFSGSQWVLQGLNQGTGPVGSATGNLNGNAQALVQKALNTLGADFAQ